MILKLKSNGKEVVMTAENFKKFSPDQQRAYHIIDKSDDNTPVDQIVVNEIKNAPDAGNKATGKKK